MEPQAKHTSMLQLKKMFFYSIAWNVLSVQCLSKPFSRRVVVENAIRIGAASILSAPFQPAIAARGAFELDSEYYLRDLFGGNKKEGNVQPSKPPALPPPRELQGPLLPLLLDNEFTVSCMPVQALVQQVMKKKSDNISSKDISTSVADSAKAYRERAKRSFSARAPWHQEDVRDQYYFDLCAYALWKTAADVLPNYTDRDNFARTVGRLLYQRALEQSLIQKKPSKYVTSKGKSTSVVSSEPAIIELLELFQSSNFCKGYRFGTDQGSVSDQKQKEAVFDELDDEALESGASVDCIVSIYEPSTLGASLQITGEQSRFAPDFVGPTLAALWESIGIKSSWEVFFVDNEYRPNPKDYFPNEVVLQFTLTQL